ncbi:MAG: SecD/SecF family protein translocase subunit, partial [Clostridia bacterium]|nr:SecD/SecF family protein translocase subunit [Clostridia bacterium]
NNHITDYELYTDTNYNRIILSFPWATGEDQNAEKTIAEISENADLMFIEGNYETINIEYDSTGTRTVTDDQGNVLTVVCDGSDITEARPRVNQEDNSYIVSLKFNEEGTRKFAEATARMVGKPISIWLDDVRISYPTVNEAITSGEASISGNFTSQEVTDLANKINAGALPFKMETQGYEVIESTLGANSLRAMAIAAVIAFIIIAIFMIFKYRLPGAVACLALLGQVAGSIAAVSGFFPVFKSFTLTLPGIAGIILSMGMGIDANIITAERIREEVRAGKSVFGAIDSGCKGSFSAIFDGNVTNVIVAIILMTIFGPPSELLSKLLGPSTVGAVYSFGYTLLIGVIFNFIMGVFASRTMLKALSGFKALRNRKLYGGDSE